MVLKISKDTGYGNHIAIKHAGGLTTWYAHLSEFHVEKGDLVKRGQLIGSMGSSGNSSGPHLHLTVQHEGHGYPGTYWLPDVVDPLDYLKGE